jgi:hypothetical protein
VSFCVEEPSIFRLRQRHDLVGASGALRALDDAQRGAMEPVLGRHHAGQASVELARRSAGLLAAQAMTLGLAQMIVDGLLGDVDPESAARLAHEVTEVLGVGRHGAAATDSEHRGEDVGSTAPLSAARAPAPRWRG